DEVERLEDEPDLAVADQRLLPFVEPAGVHAVEGVPAPGRDVETAEDVHQRRLARPRRAHHRDVVAAFDDEVDPVHGAHHRVAAAVGLRDAAQLDDRAHQRPPVRGKPEPPVAAAGVGSTSTSPSETPLMISVSAGPETPIRTGTTASTPSRRTVTVLRSPVVVIA